MKTADALFVYARGWEAAESAEAGRPGSAACMAASTIQAAMMPKPGEGDDEAIARRRAAGSRAS